MQWMSTNNDRLDKLFSLIHLIFPVLLCKTNTRYVSKHTFSNCVFLSNMDFQLPLVSNQRLFCTQVVNSSRRSFPTGDPIEQYYGEMTIFAFCQTPW